MADLAFTDRGRGPPVVLLHGFPLDRRMWRAQADALVEAGHRVVAPDLRGHGESPVEAPATMRAMADDVLALADRLGLDAFVLGGFSMGGYVAFEMARHAPGRVRALMLVDTRAEPDPDEARRGRHETAAKVRREGTRVLADAMLPKLLTPRAPPALVEEVRRMVLATPAEGAALALEGMAAREDARGALGRIGVPTLVLVGEEDAVTPPDAARAMAAGVQGAVLETVPGAAHLAPMERPAEVAGAMLRFLRPMAL